jgi:hypothetical protein
VLDLHGSVFPGLWPNGYAGILTSRACCVNRVDADFLLIRS